MTHPPLVLYGAPATGKSALTAALEEINPAYKLFPMLKAGSGRTHGYRMTSRKEIDQLSDVLWRTERYGSIYSLDRATLVQYLEHSLPVVHLGHPVGLRRILNTSPNWRVIEVICRRDVAEERLLSRDPSTLLERLAAFDSTPPLSEPDLQIDTSDLSPTEAAQTLLERSTYC